MTAEHERVTRHMARKQGKLFFFEGNPCVKKHVAKRFTKSGRCWQCAVEDAEKHGDPDFAKRYA